MEGDASLGTAYAIGDDHLLFSTQVVYHVGSFLTVAVAGFGLKSGIDNSLTVYLGWCFTKKI